MVQFSSDCSGLNWTVSLSCTLFSLSLIVSQLAGLVIISKLYMRRAREEIVVNQNSMESFLETYGQFSLANLAHSLWFVGPIALCIVPLLICVFLSGIGTGSEKTPLFTDC